QIDQRHRALDEAVGGDEGVVAVGQHVDDGVPDGHDVEFGCRGVHAPDASADLGGDFLFALVEGGDEVVVGAGEGVDTLALDRLREVVVVDPGQGQAVHHRPGAVHVVLDGV